MNNMTITKIIVCVVVLGGLIIPPAIIMIQMEQDTMFDIVEGCQVTNINGNWVYHFKWVKEGDNKYEILRAIEYVRSSDQTTIKKIVWQDREHHEAEVIFN